MDPESRTKCSCFSHFAAFIGGGAKISFAPRCKIRIPQKLLDTKPFLLSFQFFIICPSYAIYSNMLQE